MTTKKITIAPRTAPKTHEWYATTFDNPNQGAQYVLESFPELYRRALAGMRGIFTPGELKLMLDVQNGCFLMPQVAGQHLTADCEDGIALEGYDKKWKIQASDFLKKLHARSNFDLAILEIWAGAFWRQSDGGKSIDTWVGMLAGKK